MLMIDFEKYMKNFYLSEVGSNFFFVNMETLSETLVAESAITLNGFTGLPKTSLTLMVILEFSLLTDELPETVTATGR